MRRDPRPILLLLLAPLALGCKGDKPSTEATRSRVVPSNTAAPADPPAARPASAPDSALLKAEPITDGAGPVPVYLDDRHVLHVGARTASLERDVLDVNRHAWETQAKLSVVDLDGARKAVLLATPTPEEEDPPNRYRLFLVEDGGLPLVFDQVIGAYGIQELRVPGDGTVRFTEDGWTACERLGYPPVAPQQEIVFRLDPATKKMTEAGRTDTTQKMTCSELAACPYVYLATAGGEVLVGEILRDLRGRAAYAQQRLPLPARGDRFLRLRIAEEKQEVTFLDELHLEVAGEVVRPQACADADAPSYCRADGVPFVLRPGESLELEVPLPAGSAGKRVVLVARGYYVPTPTAHLRPAPTMRRRTSLPPRITGED
jgi:hypothetical protein